MPAKHEYTSTQIAEIAARGLKTGKLSQAELKAVCGSALTQARRNVARLKNWRKRTPKKPRARR